MSAAPRRPRLIDDAGTTWRPYTRRDRMRFPVPRRSRDRAAPRHGAVRAACIALLLAGAAVRADPPLGVHATPTPSGAPTIAVVTLQGVNTADEQAGVAPPPDTQPGIRFDDLPREIGTRVRVTTRARRVHHGIVRAADARRLTLSIRRHGGSATYVLKRDQIERIDPG